jgi:hypothetical protein
MGKNNLSSKKIAISGILLALCVATLFLQTIFPIANYSIYIISSLFIGIVIVEIGVYNAIIFYFASCILAFLIVPNKIFLIPYIIFFGIYGLAKFNIEKIRKIYLEIILKLLLFNGISVLSFLLIKDFLFQSIKIPDFPIIIVIIAFEIAFLAYDYFYTLFIDFYNKRIKRLLKV